MANVTQTAERGATFFGTTPRDADDASDNFDDTGAYDHRAVEYSATLHGEIMSRKLYSESMTSLYMYQNFL